MPGSQPGLLATSGGLARRSPALPSTLTLGPPTSWAQHHLRRGLKTERGPQGAVGTVPHWRRCPLKGNGHSAAAWHCWAFSASNRSQGSRYLCNLVPSKCWQLDEIFNKNHMTRLQPSPAVHFSDLEMTGGMWLRRVPPPSLTRHLPPTSHLSGRSLNETGDPLG